MSYYNYHKYRSYRYLDELDRLKKINSLNGLYKYFDEIEDEIQKMEAVKNKDKLIKNKIDAIDSKLDSIYSQIKTIKQNPSNRIMFGFVLNDECKNKIENLKNMARALLQESRSLSSLLAAV